MRVWEWDRAVRGEEENGEERYKGGERRGELKKGGGSTCPATSSSIHK
jgi:hypothetical protein